MEHASARRPAIGPRPDTTPRAPHLLRVARPACSGYVPLERVAPHPHRPNITSIEKRRYRGKAAEGEKRDAIPDLLLKHPDTTLATYV